MASLKIGWKTAAALVISNMIGTGVFTSLGYQIYDLKNTYAILSLWIIGGFLALIGAFIYSELASKFKQSGGDYIYLSRTFHPVMGYLSSWISLFVGFSAPISLAALAMSKYLNILGFNFGKEFAIVMILIVAVFQSFSLSLSSKFQNVFTILKVVFILVLIAIGFYFIPAVEPNAIVLDDTWKQELLLPAFATSLVYVTFAYTGWNSASYIIEEIDQPKKNLPKALFIGVIFVTIAYVFLNYVFLKHASAPSLVGKEDVANISFRNLLGTNVKWVSCFIALQLIATISGYLWIGSRLTQATARENKLWSFMAKENKNRIPVRAIWVHTTISILLIFSGDFEVIFTYTSFVLQVLATLAICTAFFIKRDELTIIKSRLFYLLPTIFLAFSLYICYFVLTQKPKESLIGLSIIGLGIILFYFDKRIDIKK
ncbi:basic amino acid/polyamine antiporter, APA family [Algoriella xinjiangensis]|uniref:Basic amino acid/polyamine antiporter, APA family n=1 Tax=Algoriella xinjiangensis TaxID=684065 RepID=A0A1I5ARI3_9FLAO|nr:amino acid permease [Algoriella xinjiangensis]SFN65000.1 basic amino acid/polyamine antiporter, APA family [Algoriella xinjiangensis]VDH17013.1 Serine/threonine exchanger SteT [Algoriella xinjiangensis]